MLYLANRTLNTVEEVLEKNVSYSDNMKYFNASTFSKDELGKAKNWVAGKHVKSSYKKQLEVISKNPVKVFFDLEFIKGLKPYAIWAIGFVVTKNDIVVEKFYSLINPKIKLESCSGAVLLLNRKSLKVTQEELDNAPFIDEVLKKADDILCNYIGADCFCWGSEDAALIRDYSGLAAKMLAGSQDLQKIVRHKFEVPIMSLENALKYSDYFFVHQFNPLEDALSLSFVYYFAETCDEAFISGIFAFKDYFNKKKIYDQYKSLADNKEIYDEYIKKFSGNPLATDRQLRKVAKFMRKIEEMKRYEKIVLEEDFSVGFSDMMFV